MSPGMICYHRKSLSPSVLGGDPAVTSTSTTASIPGPASVSASAMGRRYVDHSAVLMGSLIESPDRVDRLMRQVVSQLIQILLREDLRLLGAWSAAMRGF